MELEGETETEQGSKLMCGVAGVGAGAEGVLGRDRKEREPARPCDAWWGQCSRQRE